MSTLRIEINRGDGWRVCAEGEPPAGASIDQITTYLRGLAIQYAHRAWLNGVLVAGVDPVARRSVGRRA